MGGGGGGVRFGGGRGQGGCDRKIEVLGKIHPKKISRGGGSRFGGVRVDVNEELSFCENSKKKKFGGGGEGVRGGGGGVGVGLGGSGWM